jgi:hypothetical protein
MATILTLTGAQEAPASAPAPVATAADFVLG